MIIVLTSIENNDSIWFSNLFKSISITMNASSMGPVTICTTPSNIFDRSILENLGIRAIMSSGLGDHEYARKIFSSRIILPKIKNETYEALIFNFILVEDHEQLTIRLNADALALLIFIYPKKFRSFVNQIEFELELYLSQSIVIPKKVSQLLDKDKRSSFINTLRKTIIAFEGEILVENEGTEFIKLFDPSTMRISSQYFLDDIVTD